MKFVPNQSGPKARLRRCLERLREIRKQQLSDPDMEARHIDADMALLECIGDEEIAEAFEAIDKWYA
jgi:hypothetical protein